MHLSGQKIFWCYILITRSITDVQWWYNSAKNPKNSIMKKTTDTEIDRFTISVSVLYYSLLAVVAEIGKTFE